ncbi:MAG: ABC transporter permease subunit [Phycisphaerae bacterium]|jgi:NitT/TauT family transport system permease protein|nr:ABC transporter permease subunit [Phycisphaerae bacterium]
MAVGLIRARTLSQLSRQTPGVGGDVVLVGLLLAFLGVLMLYGQQVSGTYDRAVPIDLSLGALPAYAALSLARCLAAFVLSLIFTLVWGSIAAHSRRAERVMIPALDILQTIPVLSFLPPVTLALIAIVPGSEIGLELACIIMIFTGQAWNMAFGFYQAIRSIPPSLYEVAKVHRLGAIGTFLKVELPGSTLPLIYNSMMSFAGGWFFLTTIEMFTLGNKDFRLPGIGSWLATAQQSHQWSLVAIGSGVLIVLIVGTDQLLFRPLLVWAQRFKIEDQESQTPPTSWVVSLWRASPLVRVLRRRRERRRRIRSIRQRSAERQRIEPARNVIRTKTHGSAQRWGFGPAVRGLSWLVALAAMVWGIVLLVEIMWPLPVLGREHHHGWLDVLYGLGCSFGRVIVVLIVGSMWAIPVGLFIGRSSRLRGFFGPIVQVMASYPAPAYFVLITVALGSIGTPFWFIAPLLMLMGSQWYILFNAMGGASSIPTELTEMSRTYRLGWWARLRRVEGPAMFPFLVTGWVTAAGGAWNTTIVAEYVQTGIGDGDVRITPGIGSLIAVATDRGDYALLAASTMVLAIFVIVFNRIAWHRLYRLSATRFNLQT